MDNGKNEFYNVKVSVKGPSERQTASVEERNKRLLDSWSREHKDKDALAASFDRTKRWLLFL